MSEADAIAEMRSKNPAMTDVRTVRFRSGRHADFWKGNAVAVGNAYGFVEPLESTALHMVIVEIAYLVAALSAPMEGPLDLVDASRKVGAHWDYLRWFLALHYRFNRRCETDFWRTCRERVDVSGLADEVARFQREGPARAGDLGALVGDPAFGESGLLILLLGQGVRPPALAPRVGREAWAARVAGQRSLVERALPQAEALALLRTKPDLLREFVESPSSWCRSGAEVVRVSPDGRTRMPHHP